MRIRLALVAAVAAVLVVFVETGTGGAVVTKPKRTIKCLLKDYTQTFGKTKGFDFGLIQCSAPFGHGVQYDSYAETINGATGKISSHGAFKDFFNNGTVHGAYSLSGKLKTKTSGTFTGRIGISGGTGAFSAASAGGKLTCKTNDGGHTNTCTANLKGSAV